MNSRKTPETTRLLHTRSGVKCRLPMFLPVYEHRSPFICLDELSKDFGIEGIITNAFFLYKQREIRDHLLSLEGIKSYYNFDGMVVTDSGAFQGFKRPLYLSNKKIIAFQQQIGADVISPLDIITTPGEKRAEAEKKMLSTLKRIRQGMEIADRSTLIGVQQGGRFLGLRNRALEELMNIGVEYVALGSLVPFFNRNHDLSFVGKVLVEARTIVPSNIPIHVYGAGDPLELPFYVALGADIFDSSSFAHYAKEGWYMTPYGAVKDRAMLKEMGPECISPYIKDAEDVDEKTLARHNLHIIMLTMDKVRKALNNDGLHRFINEIIKANSRFFPKSSLKASIEGFADKL